VDVGVESHCSALVPQRLPDESDLVRIADPPQLLLAGIPPFVPGAVRAHRSAAMIGVVIVFSWRVTAWVVEQTCHRRGLIRPRLRALSRWTRFCRWQYRSPRWLWQRQRASSRRTPT